MSEHVADSMMVVVAIVANAVDITKTYYTKAVSKRYRGLPSQLIWD